MLPINDKSDFSSVASAGTNSWNTISHQCWEDLTEFDRWDEDDTATAGGDPGRVSDQERAGTREPATLPERETTPQGRFQPQVAGQPAFDAPGSAAELADRTELNALVGRGRARVDRSIINNAQLASSDRINAAIAELPPGTREKIEQLLVQMRDPAQAAQSAAMLRQFGRQVIPFLIKDLGSDTFAVREIARVQLLRMGPDAIPALFAEVDHPATLETRLRAMRLIEQILERSGQSTAYDSLGRLRMIYDANTRQVIFNASYDLDGHLSSVSIGALNFRRRPDGSYIEQSSEEVFASVQADQFGNVRFGSGANSFMATPDGRLFIFENNYLTRIHLTQGQVRVFSYDGTGQLVNSFITLRLRTIR